jgi:23S rRNA G2069 N7-methylase RlmK/C1962 C5-methylase RlmI
VRDWDGYDQLCACGAQVTTVDLSEKSMELARKRAAVFGLEDRIHFCAGNAEGSALSCRRSRTI